MGPRGRLLFLVPAAAVVLLDQASKAFMTHWLQPRGGVEVIPGLFDLTYVLNRGAVFGLFHDLDPTWRSLLLTVVPVLAIVFVSVMAWRTAPSERLSLVALGLVLGGAVGNLVDRLRLGAVVDFFDWHVAGHHWPAFNVADSAICVGVGLLLLHMMRS